LISKINIIWCMWYIQHSDDRTKYFSENVRLRMH